MPGELILLMLLGIGLVLQVWASLIQMVAMTLVADRRFPPSRAQKAWSVLASALFGWVFLFMWLAGAPDHFPDSMLAAALLHIWFNSVCMVFFARLSPLRSALAATATGLFTWGPLYLLLS
jgi:hypothetical protein